MSEPMVCDRLHPAGEPVGLSGVTVWTFWQALLALFMILISLHFLGVPVLPLVIGIFGISTATAVLSGK